MYKIENLSFSYGKRHVFESFNLTIKDRLTGIIGVNGAGKTTLVKLSLHLLLPDRGRILINNIDMTNDNQFHEARVGVLHENGVFPAWVKVFEHLVWVGRARGFSKEKAREQATLFLYELDLIDRWDSYVRELSAGLRQRFGIAQALIGLPDLVFLDEPTANLDARSRVRILEFIKHLAYEHEIQVIIFSHILSDLEKYCDSIAILHDGKIKYQNSLEEIFHSVRTKEYIIRYQPHNELQIKNHLRSHNVMILEEQSNSVIFVAPEDEEKRKILFHELENRKASITPYKSVVEQLFFDLIGEIDQKEKRQLRNKFYAKKNKKGE